MRDDVTRPGYEVTDVKPKGIVYFLVGLAALTLILTVLLRALFSMLEGRAAKHDRVEPVPVEGEAALRGGDRMFQPPADPLLQANPTDALAAMRASEAEVLETYGWVSREAGVARIPIDRAMDLVLERGLPARPRASGEAAPAEIGAGHGHDDLSSAQDAVAGDAIPRDANSGRGSGALR